MWYIPVGSNYWSNWSKLSFGCILEVSRGVIFWDPLYTTLHYRYILQLARLLLIWYNSISILYDLVQCRVLHCKWTPGRKVHSSHGWLNFLDFSAAARLEDLFQYFWIFEHIIMKCLSLVPLVRCATLIYSLVLSLLTLSICKMASHVILHHRITLNRRIFKALKSPFC